VWFCISWLFHVPHPPVGTYIGILAALAGLVTLWPPDNPWAKAAWVFVFGGFLVMEITTLYQQKPEDERQRIADRIAEDDRFAGLLRTQQESFAEVLRKNQEQFAATLGRIEGVKRLASESIDEQTGGKSFCFFLGNGNLSSPGSFRLVMFVTGKHAMHDVSAQIQTIHPPNEVMQQLLSMHDIAIGDRDVLPGARQLQETITTGHYSILIFARNGLLSEDLEIKLKNGIPSTSMTVTRGQEVLYRLVDDKVAVPYKIR
jgi:hypothetical protein